MQKPDQQTASSSSFASSSLPVPTTPRTPRTASTLHFLSLFTLASSYRPPTSTSAVDDSFLHPQYHQESHSTSTRSRRQNNSLGSAPNVLRKASHDSLARKPSLGSLTSQQQQQQQQEQQQQDQKDQHARFLGLRRRAISSSALRDRYGGGAALALGTADHHHSSSSSSSSAASNSNNTIFTDGSSPPALPDFAIANAAKLSRDLTADGLASASLSSSSSSVPPRASSGSYGSSANNKKPHDGVNKKTNSMDSAGAYMQSGGRTLNRSGTLPVNGYATAGGGMMPPPSAAGLQQGESSMVHQHITEMANKRISTLEYLRKAYVTALPPPPFKKK